MAISPLFFSLLLSIAIFLIKEKIKWFDTQSTQSDCISFSFKQSFKKSLHTVFRLSEKNPYSVSWFRICNSVGPGRSGEFIVVRIKTHCEHSKSTRVVIKYPTATHM